MKRTCYAAVLGGCSEKLSREHYISKSILPDHVAIKGLPWCKEQPRKVGRNSLTAQILCTTHNNQLSSLDGYAKHFKDILFERIHVRPSRRRNSFSVEQLEIDGMALERWCLKFALGLTHTQQDTGPISPDLVKICFGKNHFKEPAGLYLASSVGDDVRKFDVLHAEALLHPHASDIIAWKLGLWGWQTVLWLDPCFRPNIHDHTLLYRPETIRVREERRTRQRVTFLW